MLIFVIARLFVKFILEKNFKVKVLGRGMAWLDTVFDSLQEAGTFIRTFCINTIFKIIDKIYWKACFINNKEFYFHP